MAYRYFRTPTREFVLADTPGHVQYTRNTVTGASTAELAVLLVDARNGVVEQTRRHAAVLALLRVPRLVLAVNKIDLVDYDEAVFTAIAKDFAGLARSLGFPDEAVVTIPVSALVGDNVVERSEHTPWYDGPTLLEHLESVPVAGPEVEAPFRMPVQYVIRPEIGRTDEFHDYRGYAGQVAAGTVAPGDEVVVLPAVSGRPSPRRHRGRAARRAGRGPQRHCPAGRRRRRLPRRPARRRRRAAAGDGRDRRDAVLAGREAAASRRAPAAQARHPHHAGHRRRDRRAARRGDAHLRGRRPAQLEINDIAHVGLRTADPIPVDEYADVRATGQLPAHRPADGQHARRRPRRLPARGRPELTIRPHSVNAVSAFTQPCAEPPASRHVQQPECGVSTIRSCHSR